MIANFYLKIPRKVRILIAFLLIILFSYFVIRFLVVKTRTVPPEFLKARGQASLVASTIVGISGQSTDRIGKISQLDEEKNYTEALTLVTEELERNREARQKAVELSVQLTAMTQNIPGISPQEEGLKALEAVSSETTLISRLINYNDYLSRLLDVLRQKFLGKADGNQVPELVQKINDEARAINDLNQKFNDTMKDFDGK